MRRMSLGVAVLAAAIALVPSAASAASWTVQSPVDPATSIATAFGGTSCPSSTSCFAAGRWDDGSGVPTALLESWNGTRWTQGTPAIPSGSAGTDLAAVHCTTTSECTAVGNYDDGLGTQLPLIERWNGSAWSLQTATPVSGALGTYLTAVQCSSSTVCTAVGTYIDSTGVQKTLALRWASGSWSVQSTPNPSGFVGASLSSISCTSSTACTAVGSYTDSGGQKALAMGWNGSTWSLQTPAAVSGASSVGLAGVSCTASSACTAVGVANVSGAFTPVAMRWNGTSWALQTVSLPAGAAGASLSGVSCTSSTNCTGVGYSYTSGGVLSLMGLLWNGTTWTAQSLPLAVGRDRRQPRRRRLSHEHRVHRRRPLVRQQRHAEGARPALQLTCRGRRAAGASPVGPVYGRVSSR